MLACARLAGAVMRHADSLRSLSDAFLRLLMLLPRLLRQRWHTIGEPMRLPVCQHVHAMPFAFAYDRERYYNVVAVARYAAERCGSASSC